MQGNRGRQLPKFGEWDASSPGVAQGFTVIFNNARDDKKTKKTAVAGPESLVTPPINNESHQKNNNHHNHQNKNHHNKRNSHIPREKVRYFFLPHTYLTKPNLHYSRDIRFLYVCRRNGFASGKIWFGLFFEENTDKEAEPVTGVVFNLCSL